VLPERNDILSLWEKDQVAYLSRTVPADQSAELCVCDFCGSDDCCHELFAARVLARCFGLSQQLIKPYIDRQRPRYGSLLLGTVADQLIGRKRRVAHVILTMISI
jgi:hypothetical protein